MRSLGSRKAEALLVYLAYRGRRVERETLAALLWTDYPLDKARASLSVALSQLRKACAGYLTADRDTVALSSDVTCWVDARELTQAWKNFRKATHRAGENEASFLGLEAAVATYDGRFLDAFTVRDASGFEEWVRIEQEELQQAALSALETVARFRLERGEVGEALAHARRIMRIDALRETGHLLTMQALVRSGQRNAAVSQFIAFRQMLRDELDIEPNREAIELYRRIRTVGRSPRRPLPARPAVITGRHDTLKRVQQRLSDSHCRLLTLTGPGGVGKSLVALEAAWQLKDAFLNGACYVPVADLQHAAGFLPRLAAQLGRETEETRQLSSHLFGFLRDKEMLLVLDGFDNLLSATGLLDQLLRGAPRLRLLVTSRERLRLRQEWLLELGTLGYPRGRELNGIEPTSLEALAEDFAAIELFTHVTRKLDAPVDTKDPAEVAAIVRICQLVDGLPLALELAAEWTLYLSCSEIASRLEKNIYLLTRESPPSAGTAAELASSYVQSLRRVSPQARQAYRRMAVFAHDFDHQAAKAVAGATLPILTALTDTSLVQSKKAPCTYCGAEMRFEFVEPLRQQALAQLSATPEAHDESRERHAAYYLKFLNQQIDALHDAGQEQVLARIDLEFKNVRDAWDYASSNEHVPLLAASMDMLGYYLRCRHLYQQGQKLFGSAAQALEPPGSAEARRIRRRLLAWQRHFLTLLGGYMPPTKITRARQSNS